MNLTQNLAMNLKFYRQKYHLSQEKFAEILGTTLSYLNQIENNKVDVKCSTIDKFTKKINFFDKELHLKAEDLVTFNKKHITNFKRIDEKIKNNI